MITNDHSDAMGRPDSGVVPIDATKPSRAGELLSELGKLFARDDRPFPAPATPNPRDDKALRKLMRQFGDTTPVWRRYRAYVEAYAATEGKRQLVAADQELRRQLEQQRDEARQLDNADNYRNAIDRLEMLGGRLAARQAELHAAEAESRLDVGSLGSSPITGAGALWSLVRNHLGDERYQDYLHREYTDDEWEDEERSRLGQPTRASEAEGQRRVAVLMQQQASMQRESAISQRVEAYRRYLRSMPQDQWPQEDEYGCQA